MTPNFYIFSMEMIVIVPTTVTSSILAILTVIIAMIHFNKYKKRKIMKMNTVSIQNSKQKHSTISIHSDHDNGIPLTFSIQHLQIDKYFHYCTTVLVAFNSFSSIFNAICCIYLYDSPPYMNHILYIKHQSYFIRILSTFSWFIATLSLIWFFNSCLFHTFKRSIFKRQKALFECINIFVTVFGIMSIICVYSDIYFQHIIAEISLHFFRILYQLITLCLLFTFSNKVLPLITNQKQVAHHQIDFLRIS
eukprot:389643_1